MIYEPRPFSIVRARPKGIILDPISTGGHRIHGKVCAVLARDGVIQDIHETTNLVTDAGDLFYAQQAASLGGTGDPTNFTDGAGAFDGIMELYNSVSAAPSKGVGRAGITGGVLDGTGNGKVVDSGYPKVSDGDASNTGSGVDVVTYRTSWTTAEANNTTAGIDDVVITNPSPVTDDALLMWADGLGSFTKTSSDTLVVFVNHTMNGT